MLLRCPYCLEHGEAVLVKIDNQSVYQCESNKDHIPREYIDDSHISRANIGMVGFSGHGKTVFVYTLFYLLYELPNLKRTENLKNVQKRQNLDKLTKYWDGFYCRPLDDHTISDFYRLIADLKKGILPPANPMNFPRPALFKFGKIPSASDNFLAFYDVAGGVFSDSNKIKDQGRFVACSDVIFFIFSLTDCGDNWQEEMQRLLNIYILGVKNHLALDLRNKQDLIVILTKADKYIHQHQVPDDLYDSVEQGGYQWYSEHDSMLTKLQEHSKAVYTWLENSGCGGFLNIAKDSFRSVEYVLVSAIGAEPEGDRLVAGLTIADPKRVLDAFFWAIEKTRNKKSRNWLLERLWNR